MKRMNTSVIIIGVFLWILYLCDTEMARYGIYSFFSYRTHEVLSVIPLLTISITVIWLLSLAVKIIREKNINSYKFLCILLIVLFISQVMYILDKSQTATISFITNIDTINRDKMEIVIEKDGYDLTLDCPMLILDLLKDDGTKYGITYEWNKRNPNYGKICNVQSIN